MLKRFVGEAGRPRLFEALVNQSMVQHDKALAKLLLKKVKLRAFAPGETLISERGSDCDVLFIIHGKVSIFINGREVGLFRETGEHVGEMALVDNAPRSATVRAVEETVVACVRGPDFASVANRYPSLWRGIAMRLAKRLRERSKFVRQPNPVPRIFIGSSSETIKVARKIEAELRNPSVEVKLWKTPGIFKASDTTIESLVKQVENSDFGILVLGPDDLVTSRKRRQLGPRDNVLFELGLFMGGLKRERTFIVCPRREKIKWPSDLSGVAPLLYDSVNMRTFRQSIRNACAEIQEIIGSLGPR